MRKICQINGDCLSPIAIYLRVQAAKKFLLESIPRTGENGRFSIIALDPVHELQYRDGNFSFDDHRYPCQDPLAELAKYVVKEEEVFPQIPFQGGGIGYIGYDLISCYEDIGPTPPDPLDLPDLHFYLFEFFVLYDHQTAEVTLVHSDVYSQKSRLEIDKRLAEIIADLTCRHPQEDQVLPDLHLDYQSNFTQAAFQEVVQQAKAYIQAGDLFQVVPSQRLQAELPVEAFTYYRKLRLKNPSAYMYYLDFGETKIIGSSPESLVRVVGDTVTTNPIAGTRKRGATPVEDHQLQEELASDEKERAEHMMLIDLGRNDLSRVCEVGSVSVPVYMTIERYRYVMHIVSVVTGKLKTTATPIEALKATLPAGTVSGAPKIRAMRRIYEFEPVKRGIYAGAVGYLSFDNQLDFAIGIRTMVLKGQTAYVQAGAGIVYDSDPQSEYFETLQKAKTLLEV